MTKRIVLILAAAIACFAFAQQNPGSGLPSPYGPAVRWRTIVQGDNSRIDREEARMISGDAEWEKYYREMIGAKPKDKVRVPNVANWAKEDLLILHIGSRPSIGYGVYVETIGRTASNYYDVHYVMQEPPTGSRIRSRGTSPFVVIAIEKTTGTPRYYGRVSSQATYIIPGGCGCERPVIMVGGNGRVIPLSQGSKCSKCGGEIPVYGPKNGDEGKGEGNKGSNGGGGAGGRITGGGSPDGVRHSGG